MSKRRLSPCLDETAGPAVMPAAAAAAVNAPSLAACLRFSPVVALVANGGQEGVVFDRQQNWIYCKTLKESILTLLQWARSQSPALRMYVVPPATVAAVAAAAKDGNMCNF